MKIPFKIGLIHGGDWRAPPSLAANPWFRGYVVFLRNPSDVTAPTQPGVSLSRP